MKQIMIRQAVREDAQMILDYLVQVGSESDNLTFGAEGLGTSLDEEQALIDSLQDNPNSTLLLAFIEGHLASVGTLMSSKRERSRHYALLGISVLKKYWNQSVGTQMMQALIDFAHKAPHSRYIELEVRSDNLHAIRLYHKMGFKTIGEFPAKMHIEPEDFNTLVMVLDLKKRLAIS
jgi:ribosomal protein S18 acetylase RimI-like enzyme